MTGKSLMQPMQARRKFLVFSALGGLMAQLPSPVRAAPGDPADPAKLVIDTHCHIFNETDVPAVDFVSDGVLHHKARAAVRLVAGTKSFMNRMSPQKEREFLADLMKNGNDPERIARLCREHLASGGDIPPESRGALERAFSFRTCNAWTMFGAFSEVSLFTPSFVDQYAGSGPPYFSFFHLLEHGVLRDLAVLSGGRLHPFAPFDPRRWADWDTTQPKDPSMNPLTWVRRAVTNHGCVGVKIYPPMGFSAANNADRACGRNKEDPVQYRAKYAAKLDEAMQRLFDLCEELDIPVLAHSNDSNYVTECGKQTKPGGPDAWRAFFATEKSAQRPRTSLRISLGHLGGFTDKSGPGWTEQFISLIADTPQLYGDVSALEGLMSKQKSDALKQFVAAKIAGSPNNAGVKERLLYGSDWWMPAVSNKLQSVRSHFPQSVFPGLYGINAATYLGLRSGNQNRNRMEEIYARYKIPTPAWVKMVDAIPGPVRA